MMQRLLIIIISLLFIGIQGFSQTGFEGEEELKGIVYNKELTFDFRFHTHGFFSLAANKAKIRTYYRTTFYHLEIGTLKHARESKNNDLGISYQGYQSNDYVFGKKNSLWVVRGGYGEKRYFSEKQERKGVAVGISYLGGVTLGLLKPYHLNLRINDGDNNFTLVRTSYNEEVHDDFLDVYNILGSSGFRYGWGGIRPIPGVHAKLGVHLDWGAYDEFVKALEFGFMVDGFYKKVPIMISEDNKFLFVNVYLALQFGKRR